MCSEIALTAAVMETRPERPHVARAATNKFDAEARAIIGYRAPSPRPFSLTAVLSVADLSATRNASRASKMNEDEYEREYASRFPAFACFSCSPRGEASYLEY